MFSLSVSRMTFTCFSSCCDLHKASCNCVTVVACCWRNLSLDKVCADRSFILSDAISWSFVAEVCRISCSSVLLQPAKGWSDMISKTVSTHAAGAVEAAEWPTVCVAVDTDGAVLVWVLVCRVLAVLMAPTSALVEWRSWATPADAALVRHTRAKCDIVLQL